MLNKKFFQMGFHESKFWAKLLVHLLLLVNNQLFAVLGTQAKNSHLPTTKLNVIYLNNHQLAQKCKFI